MDAKLFLLKSDAQPYVNAVLTLDKIKPGRLNKYAEGNILKYKKTLNDAAVLSKPVPSFYEWYWKNKCKSYKRDLWNCGHYSAIYEYEFAFKEVPDLRDVLREQLIEDLNRISKEERKEIVHNVKILQVFKEVLEFYKIEGDIEDCECIFL